MQPITKAQRAALKRVFDRTPLFSSRPQAASACVYLNQRYDGKNAPAHAVVSYRQFRRTVQGPLYRSDPCIMVPWCGMWLGIEADGYTHS